MVTETFSVCYCLHMSTNTAPAPRPFLAPGHPFYRVWLDGGLIRYVPALAPARILLAAPHGAIRLLEDDMHVLAAARRLSTWHPDEDGPVPFITEGSARLVRLILAEAREGFAV